MSFDESAQRFFFGRDEETVELLRLIRRDTLTVLFGQSGLGKSSLLSAGVFPQLRRESFFPIHVRLDVTEGALDLRAQVAMAIRDNCQLHQVDAPPMRPDQTLWEYFHHDATDFWTATNQLLQPVLVFDQFEELFTLGQHSQRLRASCADFLAELGDLVENRTPSALQGEFERDQSRLDAIVFDKAHYRVVFCFREDYLAEFEGLKKQMRRIMHNRMRLLPMQSANAMLAVQKAGREFVTPEVARRIVCFVGGGDVGDPESAEALQVEPALLSLVCRELNEERIRSGERVISTELIQTENANRIIENFYDDCFRDMAPAVRRFVEDRLLTKSGFRDSCAVEEAMEQVGENVGKLDVLVQRRLLRYDVRHAVRRIELTHDVLTHVARRSRDERQANERAEHAIRQAESARRETDRLKALHADARHYYGLALAEKAERAFHKGYQPDATLFAVHALANLDRQRAPDEFQMVLGRRLSMLPSFRSKLPDLFWNLRFVPGGPLLAVNTDRAISQFDARTFQRFDVLPEALGDTVQFEIANSLRFLAARTRAGRLLLWSLPGHRQLIRDSASVGSVTCLGFSVSGRFLAFGADNGAIRVIDLVAGRQIGGARNARAFSVKHPPCAIAWSPSETSFVSFAEDGAYVWSGDSFGDRKSLALGAAVALDARQSKDHRRLALIARNRLVFCFGLEESLDVPVALHKISIVSGNAEPVRSVAISPNGTLLAVAYGKTVRLVDWTSGRDLTALPVDDDVVLSVDFSSDGRWLAAGTRNADVWRWQVPDGDWGEQARVDERDAEFRLDGVHVRRMTIEEAAAAAAEKATHRPDPDLGSAP